MNWDVLEDEVTSVVVCEAKEHPGGECSGEIYMTRYSCCNPRCTLYGDHAVALCSSYMFSVVSRHMIKCACGEVRGWKAFFRDYWLL